VGERHAAEASSKRSPLPVFAAAIDGIYFVDIFVRIDRPLLAAFRAQQTYELFALTVLHVTGVAIYLEVVGSNREIINRIELSLSSEIDTVADGAFSFVDLLGRRFVLERVMAICALRASSESSSEVNKMEFSF